MKKGFTLVELLVVVAMLAMLMGAISSSVVHARRRARIETANITCQELTKAIRAYENYATDGKLPTLNDQDASKSSIGFLMGDAPEKDVPVLFNSSFSGKDQKLNDPWGNPYRITIRAVSMNVEDELLDKLKNNLNVGVYFPNYWRRHAGDK